MEEIMKYCYLNDRVMPLNKAAISPLDLGFVRGYALLEVLRTYGDALFMFNKHYQRFIQGAKLLRLQPIPQNKQLESCIYQVIKANKATDCKIRILLSGGPSKIDFQLSGHPTLYIDCEPLPYYPPSFYTKGIKLITLVYKRGLATIKTTNYIEAIRNQPLLTQRQAQELLYVSDNKVYECSSSNILIFKQNDLIIPKNDILEGITMQIVLNLAKKYFSIKRQDIFLSDLKKANECFITSTTKEIMPVVKIDSLVINKGKVGPNTQRLMLAFHNLVAQYSTKSIKKRR
ncbi:MAG: D-alanine aminotransferase [Parcubacteria group bacterium ADurb.Bin305]|nr:aminotransferase class IV family protein [Candidatus Paceibacterota bacterium]MDD3434665.1 aminotransferase class IV [Candidatus Paceibacterota bacterium]OQA43933.1 MAG: D-alanine aminotransferase [Parcubacteria group bacterium ADurb.Bin305]